MYLSTVASTLVPEVRWAIISSATRMPSCEILGRNEKVEAKY